jgi:hypothetical protein
MKNYLKKHYSSFSMRKEYDQILRAGVGFAFAIAGLIYLRSSPHYAPKPVEMKTSNYTLIDADRDGDIDIIKRKDKRDLIDPTMIPWLKDHGNTFIDYMHQPPQITPEMKKIANDIFQGKEDAKKLEALIK